MQMAKGLNRSRLRWAALALGALLMAYCAWHWSAWRFRAEIATGYGARVACSCRYIAGRDLKSCKTDFKGLEGMWMVRLSDDPQAQAIHASVPLLASRKATFKPGFGCLPDPL